MHPADTAHHWDLAYAQGDRTRSWFEQHPTASLRMLDAAGTTPGDSIIDIGGGASPLIDALLNRGHQDLTVLDISATARRIAQQRLGEAERGVEWIVTDLLSWSPPRTYAVWHDRAVFHFVTAEPDKHRYLTTLQSATRTGSAAIFGCFAPDGPDSCSGLPVSRHSADDLAATLGDDWALIAADREHHQAPAGGTQPFTWTAFRRR
jgi:trans-aconitate methyltransferase